MFDVFYIGRPPALFPHEQPVESVEEARKKSRTRYCWVVNYLSDYTGFDFLWEPVPWQANQIHAWPSQHQVNGGTMLVPKNSSTDVNREHVIVPRTQSVPVIGIDHGNGLIHPVDISTRYISDYLGTLKRVLAKVNWEYVWVISSVCDYTNFDFTWHPSEWQDDMLHVFASNEQKYGDTFYIHVPTFLAKTQTLTQLEWFQTIHHVPDISVPRLPVPVVQHQHDSQVTAVWQHEFRDPVVQFARYVPANKVPTISLWQEKTKTIVPLSAGATAVLVPRETKNYLHTQLYDYPYINKNHSNTLKDSALDIVFISNGESNADDNWQFLNRVTANRSNRLVRIDGVKGRAESYRAALETSHTDWAFCVFAKLEVAANFDWSWQPDRMQEPKHYIFHARNPVNNLTYGHQAIIAYNKQLVMTNPAQGLDFTLEQPHEVVPVLSGIARYNDSAWTCWRTAFRECLKLRHSLPNVENEYRLKEWLTVAHGDNGQYSVWGAEDAMRYYDQVGGDFDALKKSYEWSWLASYALLTRNLEPGH